MYKKIVYVLLSTVLIVSHAEGKRSKRIRRPIDEDDSTTPQPNVVSYSTFGFNDVGSYDGFVPSSPDYASFLSDNQESTRLYAPAFPSAPDSTGFNNNFGSLDGSFGNSDDNEPQSSITQYPQSSVNFYDTPSFDGRNNNQNKNTYEVNEKTEDEQNDLVYGAKLGSKNKKQINQLNTSEFNVYSSGPLANTNDLASRFVMPGLQPTYDGKNTYGESSLSNQNTQVNVPNYPSSGIEEFAKPASGTPHNGLKFPRVVDFTKFKQYYPTELDNKYQVATYSSIINQQNEKNNDEQFDKFIQPTPTTKDFSSVNIKHIDDNPEKEAPKPNPFQIQDNRNSEKEIYNPGPYLAQDYRQNYINPPPSKTPTKSGNYNSEYKDNYKNRKPDNFDSNGSKISVIPSKGYEYSTNYSSTSFTYDFDSNKKPFNSNTDELVPASSNVVDFSKYNFRDNAFSNYKKEPNTRYNYDDDSEQFIKDKYKKDEFINQFKHLYTTTTPSSNQWGSYFKSPDFSYKQRVKKPRYEENINNDIVHIPKRPSNSYKYQGKQLENQLNDHFKQRPYKSKYDPSKDVLNTRFKPEEDLLDLRNHDTSHSSYTPPRRPVGNELSEENDYKKMVEKWRQSYLKSKYKDSYRDYEPYASEEKPLHVAIPRPYPIEVPQPVIVPIPQPYPVRIPMPKPVAVPVIRELTVPVEKPVPYPVIKNVPYPVEKPVPVIVHKEVQVPVAKPYPVHIPHVRPVFHHSRPPREDFENDNHSDDDDYLPRPESFKRQPTYKKRPRTTHLRPRRPTRTTYERYAREKRRGPQSHSYRPDRSRRPEHIEGRYSNRYNEYDQDTYENEPLSGELYYLHCKRTGNC